MANPTRKPTRLAALRLKYRGRFDAVMMIVYLLIVNVWALWAYPLGRDYAILADPRGEAPGVCGAVIAYLADAFGAWIAGYHLFNFALLYACMLCIYRIVNCAIGGPWWLGTLAATLFMANPVHTESVLNLTGSADLLPALAVLLFMAAYTSTIAKPAVFRLILSLVLFVVAVALFPQNCALVIVVLLYEWLIVPAERRNLARTFAFVLVGMAGIAMHANALLQSLPEFPERLASLYFLFYPIGYLPRTVAFFQANPWADWLVALIAVFLVALVCRGARRPAILFGVLAMVAVRIAPGSGPLDPVHLIGGGQLLTANAFYALALVALFFRIMGHPKWRFPMVTLTTGFAAVFLILQFSANLDWTRAGKKVKEFQQEVATRTAEEPGTSVGVAPDWQSVGWAPMNLSDSIQFSTPFSQPATHVSLLKLSAPDRKAYQVESDTDTPAVARFKFGTEHKEGFSHMGALETSEGYRLTQSESLEKAVRGVSARTLIVEIVPEGRELPRIILPGN